MIAAYCWPQSAKHRESIALFCHTKAASFQIEVIRQGATDKSVLIRTGIKGLDQSIGMTSQAKVVSGNQRLN
ncbi:MAG: hypothetical protein ACI9UN_002169 [Granulosicoccus sp.]|jgi:hypothetical protein